MWQRLFCKAGRTLIAGRIDQKPLHNSQHKARTISSGLFVNALQCVVVYHIDLPNIGRDSFLCGSGFPSNQALASVNLARQPGIENPRLTMA